jgi:excisionase family DNA binding protein
LDDLKNNQDALALLTFSFLSRDSVTVFLRGRAIKPKDVKGMKKLSSRATARDPTSAVMTSTKAAIHLGVGINTLLDLARRGEVIALRQGRVWKFRKADLDGWLESEAERQTRARQEMAWK